MRTILGKTVNQPAYDDIVELQEKIQAFAEGRIPEEKFKAYRLTRGVYGQRQLGVQMFRIKIPFGKLSPEQLTRIADISEKYTYGNLHLTTRQNIQLHFVKLHDSPAIWAELEEKNITAREACGNTVRNFTGSPTAGIDPEEPFDVSPYVQEAFLYFLRNPICQDMGRKIKSAFSSSEKDSAFTYFHDFGFIPRIRIENGEEVRGFKVVIGGGLGAQSMLASTAFEFLHEDKIIPFMEGAIRVFDRYGERTKRFKARLKYLVKEIGLEKFMELVEEEQKAVKLKEYKINRSILADETLPELRDFSPVVIENPVAFEAWKSTNVFEQKQKGFYGVWIIVPLGDIDAERARKLAALVKDYASDDIRITANQGLLLRHVQPEALPGLFAGLQELQLADPGFDSTADITSCPGTDTCNLGVTNSTGLNTELTKVIRAEFPELIHETNIKIKISGCMNSCGQHMAAQIGFHGSSVKKGELVIPAMQVVLGGGVDPQGNGFVADKIIKLPTKRIPEAVRWVLSDYEENSLEGEYFNDYYRRQGKNYFYNLFKPLADTATLEKEMYFDWGQEESFSPEVGVGECASVSYDVVGSIITDATLKLSLAEISLQNQAYADSIYHSYNALIVGAKALLLAKDISCNTQIGILRDFDTHYTTAGEISLPSAFEEFVLRINKNEPSASFAEVYFEDARIFLDQVLKVRENQLGVTGSDKTVVDNYYKA
ncbi:MAG: HEPN domain-containing protein [Bacteroidia bacterium]|nr:HEPN domain-containing protein [Bacteroidia bacterium]